MPMSGQYLGRNKKHFRILFPSFSTVSGVPRSIITKHLCIISTIACLHNFIVISYVVCDYGTGCIMFMIRKAQIMSEPTLYVLAS